MSGLRRFLSEPWPSSRGRDKVLELGEKIDGRKYGILSWSGLSDRISDLRKCNIIYTIATSIISPRSARKKQKPIEQMHSRPQAVAGVII